MCGEPLHQLMLEHSHLTQSLFSNEVRTISCTHRDDCFRETVNGKTPSINTQSKRTKLNNIDGICGQVWDVFTTTMVCALELQVLTAAQQPKTGLTIQLRKRAKFKPCRVVLWMACHLCTIRKPVSWLSPTIHIYLKPCRLSAVGPHGLPPSPIAAYCPWVSVVWKDYWCSFLPVFACTLPFCHRVPS